MIASEYKAIDQAAFGLQNRTIALQCITGFYEITAVLLSTIEGAEHNGSNVSFRRSSAS